MRAHEILFESFPIAKKTFMSQMPDYLGDDKSTIVDAYLRMYRDITKKNKIPPEHAKDIVGWTKAGWQEFQDHIDSWNNAPSKSELKKASTPAEGESINIHEDKNWLIVIPLTQNASCFHGRESNWCTTKRNQTHFSDYFLNNKVTLIYLLHKQDGSMYAIAYNNIDGESELFDKNDDEVMPDEFEQWTGFDPDKLIKLAQKHDDTIDTGRETHKNTDPVYLVKNAIEAGERDIPSERYIMKHPLAGEYAQKFFSGKRWPQAERAIATHARAATSYAYGNIKGPWPEAEKVIATSSPASTTYANEVLKDRFPLGEKGMMKRALHSESDNDWSDSYDVISYAKRFGNFPGLEEFIIELNNIDVALAYASDVIKGKVSPEVEKLISKHIDAVMDYAKGPLGGRWPEREKEFLTRPSYALNYARKVLKKRWPEAEAIIATDERAAHWYNKEFGTDL